MFAATRSFDGTTIKSFTVAWIDDFPTLLKNTEQGFSERSQQTDLFDLRMAGGTGYFFIQLGAAVGIEQAQGQTVVVFFRQIDRAAEGQSIFLGSKSHIFGLGDTLNQ
jgi:hypothetical protein